MPKVQSLSAAVSTGAVVQRHRSWQRILVSADAWRIASKFLSQPQCTLAAFWGDLGSVHMAILDEFSYNLKILTVGCPDHHFPSVGKVHAPAIRLERAIWDLFGHEPLKPSDSRPWLDHGRWGVRHPLGDNKVSDRREPYPFMSASGESLHQIAVGPVHAGIIEPGHFRFTANGEAIVRLEERLGYAHKGVERLMQGATLEDATTLAGRVSGDSTVAYATAFAMAVEDALEVAPPPRAQWLRALMMELERLANHYGDIGAICNDASFALMHTHCAVLRERILRVADQCFGHRMMRDAIFPGGARDVSLDGLTALRALLPELEKRFAAIVTLYEETASIQDRTVSTGFLKPALAQQFGAGGYVGRASGRNFDARRAFRYAPYDQLTFEVPVLTEGDVNARVWIRIREVKESISLIQQILRQLPSGAVRQEFERGTGEGLAIVEGFRGDILVWLRIDADGTIGRCHLRDPSWFQWPLLEAAIEGNIVADFPICNKSFNCSYSGHDLSVSQMRTLLLQGLLHQPLTEAAPRPEDVAAVALAAELNLEAQRRLGRSLSIRALDAGSCNGCELEMHALSNAFYDLERFGLKFVASPRHADVLFVTGPVTKNMREALERTHNAMPGPKWVVGVGDCAKDGGVFAKSYAVTGGVAAVLPVDLYIPGCPPRPLDMLTGLLRLLRQSRDDDVHGRCL